MVGEIIKLGSPSLRGVVCMGLSVVGNLVPIPIYTPLPNSCVCHPWPSCLTNLSSSCSMNNTTFVTTVNFQTTLRPALLAPDCLYPKLSIGKANI